MNRIACLSPLKALKIGRLELDMCGMYAYYCWPWILSICSTSSKESVVNLSHTSLLLKLERFIFSESLGENRQNELMRRNWIRRTHEAMSQESSPTRRSLCLFVPLMLFLAACLLYPIRCLLPLLFFLPNLTSALSVCLPKRLMPIR